MSISAGKNSQSKTISFEGSEIIGAHGKLNTVKVYHKRKVGMVSIMCESFRFSLGQLQITVTKTEEKSFSIRENCLVFNHIQYSKFWQHHIKVHKG